MKLKLRQPRPLLQIDPSFAHITPFWLGVLIKNLSTESAFSLSLVLSPVLWFLFHFTASAVPEYLRQPLVAAGVPITCVSCLFVLFFCFVSMVIMRCRSYFEYTALRGFVSHL